MSKKHRVLLTTDLGQLATDSAVVWVEGRDPTNTKKLWKKEIRVW